MTHVCAGVCVPRCICVSTACGGTKFCTSLRLPVSLPHMLSFRRTLRVVSFLALASISCQSVVLTLTSPSCVGPCSHSPLFCASACDGALASILSLLGLSLPLSLLSRVGPSRWCYIHTRLRRGPSCLSRRPLAVVSPLRLDRMADLCFLLQVHSGFSDISMA